jgi:hypothetical protein
MTDRSTHLNELVSRRIIQCVTECVSTGKGKTLELMDGSIVRLTPMQAKKFIEIHDKLSESSQASFRLMLVETKKTFDGVNAFCKEKN